MTVHNERAPLRADQLKRILVEQQEWSADRAFELAIEFEFAMELLKDYDELR